MAGKKTAAPAAKSKDEALSAAAVALAEDRLARIKKAAAIVMQAGYMLSKAYERLEQGQYSVEDVMVMCGSASQVSTAASLVSQVLMSHEVQPATVADQKVIEAGQAAPSGLILPG